MTTQLDLDDFAGWLADATAAAPAAPPVVLDVREPWELQTAAVTANGFDLLAIPMQTLAARLAELQQTYLLDHPIACLCHHGVRSAQVANFLAHHGFTAVVNLRGGIDAWSRQIDSAVASY